MLPRRCWKESHSRQAASPVDSTSRFTAYARAGHRLHPGEASRSQTTTTPPPSIPNQSGQRDSNPRHSAWETRVPGCICARKCLAVLRSGVTIPERVPFVPVVSCKVCTRGYRRARFDELSGAMDVVHSCKRRVITNYLCDSIARLETPTNQLS